MTSPGMALSALGPSDVLHSILELHGLAAYLLIGALAFGEAALFFGFVLPGETAVILGGVLASMGQVELATQLVVVIACAIGGDSVGYEVGKRYGERLLAVPMLARRSRSIDSARAYLRTKGGRAVFAGRFTAFLRAVMPGLAGLSRMPYRRFLAFNAAGGLIWAGGFTLLGYAAGASYDKVAKVAGRLSTALLVLVVLAFVANAIRLRRKESREATGPTDGTGGSTN